MKYDNIHWKPHKEKFIRNLIGNIFEDLKKKTLYPEATVEYTACTVSDTLGAEILQYPVKKMGYRDKEESDIG